MTRTISRQTPKSLSLFSFIRTHDRYTSGVEWHVQTENTDSNRKGHPPFPDLSYLDELGLPGVPEGRELLLVPLYGVLGVEDVDAEVTEGRTEKVLLGAVLQEGGLESRGGNLCKVVV